MTALSYEQAVSGMSRGTLSTALWQISQPGSAALDKTEQRDQPPTRVSSIAGIRCWAAATLMLCRIATPKPRTVAARRIMH
jgi:hypothetical protein